jgi:hypothetical protein
MNIVLLILVSVILLGNVLFLVHYSGLYPFNREIRRPREAFFQPANRNTLKKTNNHGYQVLTGWGDLVRKQWQKELYEAKDPAFALEKAIDQYLEDSSEKNFDLMIHLSNHINNRVRYDERINDLIERISELSLNHAKS